LRLWARADGGCWQAAGGPWRARLGRTGVSANRHEGDGTTPLGVFPIGATMYGVAPNPGVRFRYHRLACGDWWDGDPSSPTYNRFRHVRCGETPPFRGDSEALWEQRVAYRYFAVIGFNDAPVVPGRGSAIFLHADTGRPTVGCISLPVPQLVHVLRWLDPTASPRIAIAVAP
jgi:L,D-peptidoglycan transpeptidase YkuD (ErfK/YbiS/YcfS/YnhG family)